MKPVRTTADRAARLARLTEAGESGSPITPSLRQPKPSLIVKTAATLPANSGAQSAAQVMAVENGVVTDTQQTVLVRNCGDGTIPAGKQLMAEWCGKLGYVVQRGGGVPKFKANIFRYLTAEPIPAESQGEDTAWQFGVFDQWVYGGHAGQTGYKSPVDLSSAGALSGGVYRWVAKMNPLRFKLTGYGDGYHGGSPRMYSPGLFAEPYDQGRKYSGGGNPGLLGEYQYGLSAALSSLTPPAACHLQNFSTSGVFFSANTVQWKDASGMQPMVFGLNRQWRLPNGMFVSADCSIQLRKVRLWIDGADETGVVTPSFFTYLDNGFETSLAGAKLATAQSPVAKSMWVDAWYDVTVLVDEYIYDQGVITGTMDAAVLPLYAANNIAVIGGMDWFELVNEVRKWKLEFDANGPTGVSELITYENNGSMISDGALNWTDGTSYGNRVAMLVYGEIPLIYVRKPGVYASPTQGVAVYAPENTGDYDPLIFANAGQLRIGCWDPTASTVFRRVGGHVANIVIGQLGGNWLDLHGAGDPVAWDSNHNTFPATITVSPYP